MENGLGPIEQLGYVVDDIEGAMGHWVETLGVGPFYFLPAPPMQDLSYRGQATGARIAVALSFSGPLQIELIQPLDDEPTPYRDFLAAHGTGLHHVARFVEDYDDALARYGARGLVPFFGGRGLTDKQRFCYFDTETHGGTCSEIIETVEIGGFFDAIRAAATDWDGSNPVRTVGGVMAVGRIVFTHARVLDAVAGTRPGSTVVVQDKRITSVGDGTGVETGADDRVVDLGGRTVMPGMVTCHFHSTYHELGLLPGPFGLTEPPALQAVRAVNNLEKVLMSGFTSAVSAGAPFGIDASMATAIAEGAIVGPRLVPGSRDVSTTGHANDYAPWYWGVSEPGALHLCDGPDEFRRAVRQEIKEGARMIKMFVTGGHGVPRAPERIEMTREEMAAAIEAAHMRGAKIRGHLANREAIMMALDLGIDVVDHGDGMDAECIDRMVEAGTFVVPSMFFLSRYAEVLKDQAPAAAQSMQEELDQALTVLPVAQAAGVKLVLGDDYGAAGFPHGIYGQELEFYVKVAGMAPLEVLRWATVHGAALMDRADDLGTVTAGKRADLLVVDGDPLSDISVLADPARLLAIMKDGRLVKDELASL